MTKRDPTETKRLRKQLYEEQGRRCPVCDIEYDWRETQFYLNKPSGKVICHRCWSLTMHIRKYVGPILDRAVALVTDYIGCVDGKPLTDENLTEM